MRGEVPAADAGEDAVGHAWTTFEIRGKSWLVDAMLEPGELLLVGW